MEVYSFRAIIAGGTKKNELHLGENSISWNDSEMLYDKIVHMSSSAFVHIISFKPKMEVWKARFKLWYDEKNYIEIEFDASSPKMNTEGVLATYKKIFQYLWGKVGKRIYQSIANELDAGKSYELEKNIVLFKDSIEVSKKKLFKKTTQQYPLSNVTINKHNSLMHHLKLKDSGEKIGELMTNQKDGTIYKLFIEHYK